MSGQSRSTLFLMEQIIVITVFAICAAVCVKILVVSYLMTVDAVDTKHALIAAESMAESYKAFAGNTAMVAEIIGGSAGGSYTDGTVTVYFDSNWQPHYEAYAVFVLQLTKRISEPGITLSDITVNRAVTGDELISLTVAVRGGR